MSEPYNPPLVLSFRIQDLHHQVVVLRNTHWDRVVDINHASLEAGAAIVFATASGSETQRWRIVYHPDTETVSFVSVYSGKAIEAVEASRLLCQHEYRATPAQRFQWDAQRGLLACQYPVGLFWNLSLEQHSVRDWFDPKVPPLGMWRQVPVVVPVRLCDSYTFNPPLQFERPGPYAVGFVNPRGSSGVEHGGYDREQIKCLANLPLPDSTNPIASLMNYCRHYLMLPVEFAYVEKKQTHHYEVWIGNRKVGESEQPRKTQARECAARAALVFLNQFPDVLVEMLTKK